MKIKRFFSFVACMLTCSLFGMPEAIIFDFGGVMTKKIDDRSNAINICPINQDMFALVETLRENHYIVGLLSNISYSQAMLLDALGLYEPFDPCLLSCEIDLQKPDIQIYDYLLKQLTLPPQNIVFIDDRPINVSAAKELGIDAILFESVSQITDELISRGLTFLDDQKI